ncbi:hypothetical protein BDV10DRAFT_197899 [Aspergillus recurvatus]
MAIRRAHRKSRHGCTNCKQRRVKCDETRPYCQNCTRRNNTCVYVTSVRFVLSESDRQRVTSPKAARGGCSSTEDSILTRTPSYVGGSYIPPRSATARTASLDLVHLELELHWILHTHKLFARNEDTRRVWEVPVLQEALRTPFLMHGILAISALHRAHLYPHDRQAEWISTAVAHHSTGLALFTKQLDSIDESSAKAMTTFAAIAGVFSFASTLQSSGQADGPSLNALADILVLARGVQTIGSQAMEFLRPSTFAPLYNFSNPEANIPDDVLTALDYLESLNAEICQRSKCYRATYYERTIQTMRELAPFTYAEPASLTFVGGWAVWTPPEFLEGVRAREPFALVILAHFCVFMHTARHHWCIGSWGQIVLREIVQSLETDWHTHIKWPLVQVLA